MKKRYLMLGLLVAAAGAAHAADNKVYKWKDANGVMHFSDAPPPKGQQFDNVKIVGQSAPITTTDPAKPADAAAAAPGTAEPGSAEEQKAKQCTAARQREQLLAGTSQLSLRREGKDVLLEGAEREAELSIARARVQQYCPAAGT